MPVKANSAGRLRRLPSASRTPTASRVWCGNPDPCRASAQRPCSAAVPWSRTTIGTMPTNCCTSSCAMNSGRCLLLLAVAAAGRAHGIHVRSLQRAARRLGITIAKTAFRGGWVWFAPDATKTTVSSSEADAAKQVTPTPRRHEDVSVSGASSSEDLFVFVVFGKNATKHINLRRRQQHVFPRDRLTTCRRVWRRSPTPTRAIRSALMTRTRQLSSIGGPRRA